MNHLGTVNIETERLLLRRFQKDDAMPMFKNWANDPDVTKYLTWLPHENIVVTENILDSWIEQYKNPERYNWAIVPKDYGKVIGSIGIVSTSDDNNYGEIGYCISKDYWGRGMTAEALTGIIQFLFDKVGFNRLQAFHHAENRASGRVMEKAGMKYEGRLREYHMNTSGVYVDCDMYAILKKDFG